jgi:hypothetical protein
LGKSVLDLLGGPVHERLPAIASCHAHYASIPEMAEETAEWVSTGLQGLKTGFGKRGNARLGYDHDRDVAYVKAMREVLGDKMLMIDNGIAIKWDVTDAVRRAKAMEEYNLAWIEEPLGAWDPEGYANLRAKTTTRIAYGEREWTLEQFERVLATGTVDVVGVDPGRAEGITGFKQIDQRCEFYRRQANAHAWSSAIVSAASLAISFNSPACKLFELKPLRNPMQHDLVTKAVRARRGLGLSTDRPGPRDRSDRGSVVDGFRSEKVLSSMKGPGRVVKIGKKPNLGGRQMKAYLKPGAASFVIALALAGPPRSRRQSIANSDFGREGRRRAVRGEARLGNIQARRPDRGQSQGGRKNQLCLLLSGLRHSAVLAAIRGRFRDRLQGRRAIYPMDCASIAPVQNDPNQQVSQIEAKLAAGEIDCISIEPTTSDSTTAIVNKLMDQGIPVFTVGVTSRGHEFTNFTQCLSSKAKPRARSCSIG